jgi:tRNA pseudouridine55 synthase
LIPAGELLPEFPTETVDAATAAFIQQGRDFRVSPFRMPLGARFVKAVTDEGELIAIGEAKLPHVYHPLLVL